MLNATPVVENTCIAPEAKATHIAAPATEGRAGVDLNIANESSREEYLDRKTELELSRKWHEHRDYDARERLIRSHLRLASKIAAGMKREVGSENDLIQEASIGLMKAVDKFDPSMNNRFATYAQWWIRATIQDAVMRDNSTVRLKTSSTNRTAFFTLPYIEECAEKTLRRRGSEPTQVEIAKEAARMMGIDTARLNDIKSALPTSTSLNAPIAKNEDDFGEAMDLLVCPGPNGEDIAVRNSDMEYATETLKEAFSVLNDRHIRIIQARTMSLEPLTLEALSYEFGVSRERIRQLEAKAVSLLRDKMVEMGIDGLEALGLSS